MMGLRGGTDEALPGVRSTPVGDLAFVVRRGGPECRVAVHSDPGA